MCEYIPYELQERIDKIVKDISYIENELKYNKMCDRTNADIDALKNELENISTTSENQRIKTRMRLLTVKLNQLKQKIESGSLSQQSVPNVSVNPFGGKKSKRRKHTKKNKTVRKRRAKRGSH